MVVDLPAPLGPRKPVTRPGSTVKSIPSTAVVVPNLLVSAWAVIMALTLLGDRRSPHRGTPPVHP